MINFISGVMLEAADLHSMVYSDKIIDWANGGMVLNFFFFSSFSFVAVG